MKTQHTKKFLKIFIFVFIGTLLLGIGYALITEQILTIDGSGTATEIPEDLNVHFDRTTPPTITKDTGSVSIDDKDARIAYVSVTGLAEKGDKSKATYTIINDSRKTGTNISLNLTNSNTEFFKVTAEIHKSGLIPKETTTVDLTIELIKNPKGIKSTILQTTLSAIAVDEDNVSSSPLQISIPE